MTEDVRYYYLYWSVDYSVWKLLSSTLKIIVKWHEIVQNCICTEKISRKSFHWPKQYMYKINIENGLAYLFLLSKQTSYY